MKKKIVAMCATVAMAAVAVGGTLAYFTDDDQAKNTFALGGVDIAIQEMEYTENGWEDLKEGENGAVDMGQLDPGVVTYYNKCVQTNNLKDDAYVRNYVAIESIAGPGENEAYKIWHNSADYTDSNGVVRHGAEKTALIENVEIDGVKYDIWVYDTIGGAIVKEGESFLSLTTVTLDADVTNDDVTKMGKTLDVYTFSEAIQTAGFADHAEAMKALIGEDGTLEAHAAALLNKVIKPAA